MVNKPEESVLELGVAVVNYGSGSKVLHMAKKSGIPGGTIFFGRGTAESKILEFLGISDIRKEVVLMGADADPLSRTVKKLDEKFHFAKKNHGIVFAVPVHEVIGTQHLKSKSGREKRGDGAMYQAITIIVERGKAEDVMEAAKGAGSKGGTIINARGSGVHETQKIFKMEIEPEREIVLILAKEECTDNIVQAVKEKLDIEKPGNGIIFIQDVSRAYGLYE